MKQDIKRKRKIVSLKMCFKCAHAISQPQVFRQRIPEDRRRARDRTTAVRPKVVTWYSQ